MKNQCDKCKCTIKDGTLLTEEGVFYKFCNTCSKIIDSLPFSVGISNFFQKK